MTGMTGCLPSSQLPSSQLSNNRREGTGGVSAEHEVGETDLLASPLDLLGSGRGITGQERQRIRGSDGGGVGVRSGHECSDRVADHRYMQRQFHAATIVEALYPLHRRGPRLD